MSKELIVSAGRHETRVAIIEDDQLVELFHQREKEYSLAGSIHKGRVTRVLPGMQSAFVDIGLERDAFLYVSDFFEDNDEYDAVVSTVEEKVLKMEKGGGAAAPVEIVRTVSASAVGGTDVVVSPPDAARGGENRPAGGRDGARDGNRDNNNKDRRGRRGRRRGGRGTGGLPESKFFSPPPGGGEAEPVEVAEDSAEAEEVQSEQHFDSGAFTSGSDDFMVLPGESLAKYSANDDFEAPAPEPYAQTVSVDIEPVVPAEHVMAGIGSVPSWMTSTVAETPESAPVVEAASAESVAVVEAPVAVVEAVAEAVAEPVAEPVAEESPAAAAEVAVESIGEPDVDDADDADGTADIEDGLEATGEAAVDGEEGPEPARIPTSLTAALREQGNRYPHRASRRSRRRGRGGERGENRGGENREKRGPADAAVVEGEPVEVAAPAEVPEQKTVVAREERRPDRGRDRDRNRDRGDRDKDRDSSERPDRERPVLPSISDLLKEGQEIIVQIAKEPLGQKGARITSHIALPGRFVVYMPTVDHAGVSRKIPSDEERQRLKRVLQTHRQGISGGFICRTAAEGKTEEELRADMHFLYNLWLDMRQKAEKKPAPVLLHHDLDLVQRILRDQLTTSFKTIWVDNEELYESILRFVERFQPALVGRVKLYTRANPIFDEFSITAELEKALRPKVWLKSGGYIVINQTEALVAIDINTGKYVGKSNRLEDTIVKVNTDAIKEIVRQIRLRDLGGIIVVDFIDMDERKNRQKVMMALEDSMRSDRAPYKILQFNDFGLVAITRKRVKQSLERTLCAPCPYCEGAGYIKSVGTVISEILIEAQRMHKALELEQTNLMLRVNPEVAKVLKSNQNSFLQEIEEILGRNVLVKSDPLLHQTKFDLA